MTVAFRFTSEDLECMPDIEGVRYEIIDGELYVSRAPQVGHQYACSRITQALENWNDRTGRGVAFPTPGLVFSPDNDVIPDVVWISRERLGRALDEKGHLREAPELVVEVLSPGPVNQLRDRQLKLDLYARQGVQEYWIVDWQLGTLEVYRRGESSLELAATLQGDDALTAPLLPGFRCRVASLWELPIGVVDY